MKKVFCFYTLCMLQLCNVGCETEIQKQQRDIEFGKLLFFDTDLSLNQNKSCASCHDPELYFTDGYRKTIGAFADVQSRNTPSIINSVDFKTLNWACPNITDFIQQMQTPLFSKVHVEMGMSSSNETQAKKILAKEKYKKYLRGKELNWNTITKAIAAFEKTVVSRNSKYDLFVQSKDSSIFTKEEMLGMQLFFSDKTKCGGCHGGIDFNTPKDTAHYFSNTGLYAYEKINMADSGLANITKKPEDIGKFRIASLRNVAKTEPYYHDGSGASLGEVIDNYSKGGRVFASGSLQGNGVATKNKNKLLQGFVITEEEKRCLLLFLQTLTDTTVPIRFKRMN
jgi:cytochrome c peroxidase